MKNILLKLLTVIFALTLCVAVFSACEDKNSSKGLEYKSITIDGESGYSVVGLGTCTDSMIIIPKKHDGKPVLSIGEGAFFNCPTITTITISYGVKTIGPQAFAYCDLLRSVEIGDGVETIESSAFSNCSNLREVKIGNGLKTLGYWAFLKCDSLTTVDIGDGLKTIQTKAFSECESLKNLSLGKGLEIIEEGAFSKCESLESVNLPSAITNIGGGAFNGCSSLKEINIENDSNLKYIGEYAFHLVDYSLYKTENDIEYIKVNSNPYYIANSIKDTGLSTYLLNSETKVIMPYLFKECTSLTNIDISKNVKIIGEKAFYGCTALKNIYVSKNNSSFKSPDGSLYSKDGKTLIQYAIGKRETEYENLDGVIDIGDFAFAKSPTLKTVTIGGSVKNIGNHAFEECSLLESATIDGCVTDIGDSAFDRCGALKTLTIGENVVKIGQNAFSWCDVLNKVNFLGSVEDWAQIDFYDPYSNPVIIAKKLYIKDKLLEEAQFTNIKKISNYAFIKCLSLTKVVFSEGVESIGDSAFSECANIIELNLPKSLKVISEGAFSWVKVQKVDYKGDIDDWVQIDFKGSNPIIESNGLYINGKLVTEVKIFKAKKISNYAFYNYKKLTNIIIGKQVETIGEGAFRFCDLVKIYCEAESKPDNWIDRWNYDGNNYIPVVWGYKEN